MEYVAFGVAVLMIIVGMAGVGYGTARAVGQPHRRAALIGWLTILPTFAVLLWLLDQPQLITSAGWLLGAVALCGLAWWLWERRPRYAATSPQGPTWQPEQAVARVQAGMGSKWIVEEL